MKKSFLKSLLSEPNSDEWSHKRLIGFLCAISLIIEMFLCSLKWMQPPPEFIADSISYIAIGALLGTVGERIISKYKKEKQTSNSTSNE